MTNWQIVLYLVLIKHLFSFVYFLIKTILEENSSLVKMNCFLGLHIVVFLSGSHTLACGLSVWNLFVLPVNLFMLIVCVHGGLSL